MPNNLGKISTGVVVGLAGGGGETGREGGGSGIRIRRARRCGLAVRRLAGKQKDLGSIRFGSPVSSLQKLWFMDSLLTLPTQLMKH